jgi:hypothetical protein
MAGAVYKINRGINRPIVVKGLKAQYVWWMAGGLVALLLLFAVLYLAGLSSYVCVAIVLGIGGVWGWYVYRLSNRYGQFGMMKAMARKRVPRVLKGGGRKGFIKGGVWKSN